MKSPYQNSKPFRAAAPLLALAAALPVPLHAAVTPLTGDHAVVAGNGGDGNLYVAADLDVAGRIDFGTSYFDPDLPGAQFWFFDSYSVALFDINDPNGRFQWRDNLGGTVREKMKLDQDNVLSLYNVAGSATTITLNGGNGQINLTGTGSGIYSGGTAVFSLASNGALEYGSTRPISILNASAATAFSGALRIEGGFAARKDSYVSDLRIGMGNNSVSQNTAFGRDTLNANTTGNNNTAIGMWAMRNNTSGQANTAVGSFALQAHTNGEYNAAFGASALGGNTTGSYNSAFGKSALNSNTTAHSNSAFGHEALRANSTGLSNSAVGRYALYANTLGYYNTGLGTTALCNNTTGSNNIAIGYYSGRYQADGSTSLTDPENSIYIGNHTRGFSNADSNSIVIGYQAIGEGANSTVIGNSSTVTTRLYGQTKAGSLKVSGASDLNNQVVVEPAVAPDTAVRAMRVLADGTILIKRSGDIPMGTFTAGQQP